MKTSKFIDEQIALALRQAQAGTRWASVSSVSCATCGVSRLARMSDLFRPSESCAIAHGLKEIHR